MQKTMKFNLKQVIETDGRKSYVSKGTVILYEDPKKGIIKTNDYGDLHLFQQDKPGKEGRNVYDVKKKKPGAEEGKSFFNEVGTLVLDAKREKGTLFVHLLTDSFAVFARDEKDEKPKAEAA